MLTFTLFALSELIVMVALRVEVDVFSETLTVNVALPDPEDELTIHQSWSLFIDQEVLEVMVNDKLPAGLVNDRLSTETLKYFSFDAELGVLPPWFTSMFLTASGSSFWQDVVSMTAARIVNIDNNLLIAFIMSLKESAIRLLSLDFYDLVISYELSTL